VTAPSGALTAGSMKPSRARAVRVRKVARVPWKIPGMFATRSHLATRVAARSACLESRTRAEILAIRLLALSFHALQFHPLHPLRQVHLLQFPQPLRPRLRVRLPPAPSHITLSAGAGVVL